jgi:hypothetical protein
MKIHGRRRSKSTSRGKRRLSEPISKAGAHSRITAIAVDPRDVSENRLLIPFTVAGNKVQTVTVTIRLGTK